MKLDFLLNMALEASKKASKAILNEKQNLKIWQKDDKTFLSSADIKSNDILFEELKYSDIAICSEENQLSYDERKNLSYFWLIDPLDGTKGFLNNSKEYCILIALIHQKRPILSIIVNVEENIFYYGHKHSKIYKNNEILKRNEEEFKTNQKTALISNNHQNTLKFLEQNSLKPLKINSALKFVYLLDGKASIYHRLVNLNSWDIAAGDFLINHSLGYMKDINNNFISYNEISFKCPYFLALAKDIKYKALLINLKKYSNEIYKNN